MIQLPEIECFTTAGGVKIYRIPCEVFPGFVGFAHLLFGCGPLTLVDVGSGYGHSDEHLFKGFEAVRDDFGEKFQPADIRRIIITHGHVDHFGGLRGIVEHAPDAEIGIHKLDRRVLSHYEERVIVATKSLRFYLQRAGVKAEDQAELMQWYGFSKKHVHSFDVDFTIADGDEIDGMTFIHTPGHCPGQVCIGLGDVLLTADHVLPKTTPHQAPERITAYTGLGHYFESLDKVGRIAGFDLGLGGHEEPMRNLYERIDEIRVSHEKKLARVIQIVRDSDAPTIRQVTATMYPKVEGFHVLLAIEEVGAHVEYLYQHGDLVVCNLDELEREENPALRFVVA
jgi:glyoxylase-like metal-dependent hydrolase (beta-lactamase superfamily II)